MVRAYGQIYREIPFGGLQVCRSGRSDDALIPCGPLPQALALLGPIRRILSPNPIRVCVPRSHFAERPQKALGRTLKIGFVEVGADCHAPQTNRLRAQRADFSFRTEGICCDLASQVAQARPSNRTPR